MTTARIILYLIKVFKLQKTLLHFEDIQEFCLWMLFPVSEIKPSGEFKTEASEISEMTYLGVI